MRRIPALFLTLALIASACGGGDDSTQSEGGGDPQQADDAANVQAEIADAAETLLSTWDDEEAFYAVITAMDNGYSAGQIMDGAADVSADGTIGGVDPEGAPQGLLSPVGPDGEGPPSAAGLGVLASGVPLLGVLAQDGIPADQYVATLDAWAVEIFLAGKEKVIQLAIEERIQREAEAEFTQAVAWATLELASRGYSEAQILEGFLSFDIEPTIDPVICFQIGGPDGPVIPLADPWEGSICNPIEAPEESPDTTAAAGATTSPPTDDSAEADSGIDGEYVGGIDLPADFRPAGNEMTITIEDGQVTSVVVDVFGDFDSVTEDASVLCVSDFGFSGSTGPGVVSISGNSLSGTIDLRSFQTLGAGAECDPDLVNDAVAPSSIAGTIDGDAITGTFDGAVPFSLQR